MPLAEPDSFTFAVGICLFIRSPLILVNNTLPGPVGLRLPGFLRQGCAFFHGNTALSEPFSWFGVGCIPAHGCLK